MSPRGALRGALAVALGALAVPSLAFASGHHGGHHGGGGSGGSSGGTATTGYGTTYGTTYEDPYRTVPIVDTDVVVVRRCHDATDVVGMRHCKRFGEWSQNLRFPKIFVDTGVHVRHIPVLVYPGGAEMKTGTLATMSALRLGVDLPAHLYAAIEGELGTAAGPALETAFDGGSPQSGMFLGGYGVLGARFGTRRAELAFEAAGGGRHVASGAMTDPSGGVLEARARGELWLAPWVTLGGTVGASVVEHDDWMAGLYLGIHSRAFDGGR